MLVQPGLESEVAAPLELGDSVGVAARRLDVPDRVQRVDQGFGITEPLRELDRPGSPRDRSRAVVSEHSERGDNAVRHRELVSRLEGLEKLDGLLRSVLRLCVVPDELEQACQPPKLLRLLQPVAKSSVALERAPSSVHSGLVLFHEVRLVRVLLEQLGATSERGTVGRSERAPVVGGGLTMGADGGSAFRSGDRVSERRIGVPCSLGVVHEALEVEGTRRR